jgi:hypothetical protein
MMPNIRVDASYTIVDGSEVVFLAPCNCDEVSGLKVYHPGGSKVFTFKDAHGTALTGIGSLFAAGVLVKAILDVTNGYAYLQNADTNAYLEKKFTSVNNAATNAKTAADNAQTTANSANTAAAAAKSTADAAKTAAGNAQTSANTANTAAGNAQSTANTANSTANEAKRTADAALPKAGGTMTGQLKVKGLVLTSGTDYGTTLPAAGTPGRIFFKKVT